MSQLRKKTSSVVSEMCLIFDGKYAFKINSYLCEFDNKTVSDFIDFKTHKTPLFVNFIS